MRYYLQFNLLISSALTCFLGHSYLPGSVFWRQSPQTFIHPANCQLQCPLLSTKLSWLFQAENCFLLGNSWGFCSSWALQQWCPKPSSTRDHLNTLGRYNPWATWGSYAVCMCQLQIDTYHLPLQGLNLMLLQLLIFNTPWKEFRVKSRNEALCAPGWRVRWQWAGATGRTGLQVLILRASFMSPVLVSPYI